MAPPLKVCIASGKGGTGKTLISTSLALFLSPDERVQLLDCDVEAPNAHVFLRPTIRQRTNVSVTVPRVDEEACAHCGKCAQACRFHAIASLPGATVVYDELCHSCGVCVRVCPNGALRETERVVGVVEVGDAQGVAFVRGRLNVGEARGGPVISAVKSYADPTATVLLDAPPGTSCPVIQTLKGVDLALLVTEPTPFGLHDLRLAVQTARAMGIPFAVVINRDGVGDDRVDAYCNAEGIAIWARIPHDRGIAEVCADGGRAVETSPALRSAIEHIATRLKEVDEGRR